VVAAAAAAVAAAAADVLPAASLPSLPSPLTGRVEWRSAGVALCSDKKASEGRSVEDANDARAPEPVRSPLAAAAEAPLALWSEIRLGGTRHERRLPGGAPAGTVSFTVRPPGNSNTTGPPAAAWSGTARRSSSRTPRSDAHGANGAEAALVLLLLMLLLLMLLLP
jgi:hypothetical protein